MDALFHLFTMTQPGVVAINIHTLPQILEGEARARSRYFTKRNIFENINEIVGPYLEDGNHWTFFFAEAFLGGAKGYLACSPVQQERERLGLLLFSSLDRSGFCGICHKTLSRKSKEKSSVCLANIHKKCIPDNQEDAKCYFCKDSSGESNEIHTETKGQDSSGESTGNGFEAQDSSGESTGNGFEAQDSSGKRNGDGFEAQGSSDEKNSDVFEAQDNSGERNGDGFEAQVSSDERNSDGFEAQDNSGERKGDGFEGQGNSGENNQQRRKSRTEGKDSLGTSNQNSIVIEGEHKQDHSVRGFLVESVLKVSDFHQAKRYLVTSEELQRRCSPPESYSANTVVAYLRKAKGQKRKIAERLAELDVMPSTRTKLTSQCSKLCEDECSDLADDLMYLAAKTIPQKRVAQALPEEGNVHAALARTEDCMKTLKAVENDLEAHWETFNLATHGLGPAVIKGTISLIDSCLKEKMKALKTKNTDV
ncbi:uncharacterized protein isoform X2 [Danio rerio]|uniref:Uncharacterized protein isoform X2 n=1 Tax=Danio rerio TaxID=7955 RepID=A0AC58GXI4_DANRE